AADLAHRGAGWAIPWKGQSGTPAIGRTMREALGGAARKGTEVAYVKDGGAADGADVEVVVVGETPYAEMLGDREDLALAREDLDVIANVKKAGIPLVLVVVSGRPLILGEALDTADAVVAAWLPGPEGAGVADDLLGGYQPTGQLSFSWPRSTAQIPINIGDAKYSPQFPFGFGLTY